MLWPWPLTLALDKNINIYQIWQKLSNLWQSYWWFSVLSLSSFKGCNFVMASSRAVWTELYQIWWRHTDIVPSKTLSKFLLGFQYVASFWKQTPFKAKCFTPPVKNRGEIGKISQSIFRQIICAVPLVKIEHFKGNWGQKSRPILALFWLL